MEFTMKAQLTLLATTLLLAALPGPALAKKSTEPVTRPVAEQPVQWSSIIVRSTCKPRPVKGTEGKWNLVYELEVANFRGEKVEIDKLEVFDSKDSKSSLLKLSGKNLKSVMTCVAAPHERTYLNPGETGIIWVNIAVDKIEGVISLDHRFELKGKEGKKQDNFELSIDLEDAVKIGPPLTGKNWLAMGGYSGILGHRRALMPIGNRLVLSQRYAIDWIKFDKDWHTFKPDGSWKQERDSVCYGEPLLAVTDGVIVGAVDKFEDQPNFVEGTDMGYPGGNCITLKMDNGYYAFYAHLKPGSLKVKTGDRVKRGQVIGLVGNSGHSFEPHLHFHMSDSPGILLGNGIPYVFDKFEYLGEATDLKRYNTNKPRKEPAPKKLLKSAEQRQLELPAEGSIVNFEP